MTGSAWLPDEVHAIVDLLAGYSLPWAVCGGWAVDLFAGRQTRAHKDIDVALLRRDQLVMQSYLSERGWSLEIAHDGVLTPWKPRLLIELPVHGVWCRNAAFRPDFLELLLNEGDEREFRFRRDSAIRMPFERAFVRAPCGVPVLAPELALLYKSAHPELPENAADWHTALPLLSSDAHAWLRNALARSNAHHPWLNDL